MFKRILSLVLLLSIFSTTASASSLPFSFEILANYYAWAEQQYHVPNVDTEIVTSSQKNARDETFIGMDFVTVYSDYYTMETTNILLTFLNENSINERIYAVQQDRAASLFAALEYGNPLNLTFTQIQEAKSYASTIISELKDCLSKNITKLYDEGILFFYRDNKYTMSITYDEPTGIMFIIIS